MSSSSEFEYSEGYDPIEEENKRRAEAFEGKLRRYYLPAGKLGLITFVTDKPINFEEYSWYYDGSWRNWASRTKSGPLDDVPGVRRYFASAWVVVDHVEWVDKEDKKHQHEPRLFVAKAQVGATLRRKKDSEACGGTLAGCRFEVIRTGEKSPSTGNEFEFKNKFDLPALRRQSWWPAKFEVPPMSWSEILAPPSPERFAQIKAVLSGIEKPVPGAAPTSAVGSARFENPKFGDDIPF